MLADIKMESKRKQRDTGDHVSLSDERHRHIRAQELQNDHGEAMRKAGQTIHVDLNPGVLEVRMG